MWLTIDPNDDPLACPPIGRSCTEPDSQELLTIRRDRPIRDPLRIRFLIAVWPSAYRRSAPVSRIPGSCMSPPKGPALTEPAAP
jgi:hypothetical protein